MMPLFAIIAPAHNDHLAEAVAREFPNENFELAAGQYIVSAPHATTKEIGQRIGDTGTSGRVIVLPMQNWWGWHKKDLWEWLSTRTAT